LAGGSNIFSKHVPTGSLVKGEGENEGGLVLRLTYPIAEKKIVAADVIASNLEKLIARPIDGESVGITGEAADKDFKAVDVSPYTAHVEWDSGTRTTGYRFIRTIPGTATITLNAKDGFIFDSAVTSVPEQVLADAVAIEAWGDNNVTPVLSGDYKFSFGVGYDDGTDV
jgi:hypothetical protein